MNGRKLSPREHLLILAACGIMIVLGYTFFRYRPAEKEIKELIRETDKVAARRKEIDLPNDPSEELRRLEKEKREVEQALTLEREKLDALERTFAPVDALEILHGLQVEVSELAASSGLRIVENVPYVPKAAATARGAAPPLEGWSRESRPLFHAADGTPLKRPLRRIQLAGSYGGFKRFLRGLNRLSLRVTVVQYAVESARNSSTGSGEAPLVATLILAF